jgi:hypothetical protein
MPEGSQLNLKLTPGEILIAAGALVTLIFSFFNFYKTPSISVNVPGTGGRIVSGGGGVSAWGAGLLPIATIIVIFCVVMGLQVVLTKVASVDLGSGIAGFSWPQVHLALGFFAFLDAVAFLVVKKGGADIGVGLIFILIGSAACLAGAVLINKERAGNTA